jgi:lactose/L-arabinose transport system ATP-binding protein
MARLKLEKITKTFNETPVIHGIDLTVQHGEFCVFVGPSGCGKSTLLRLIAGLEECTAGQITLDDQDITHSMPSKRGMAMVFQSYALYPHMTVEENMGFGLKIAKVDKANRTSAQAPPQRVVGRSAPARGDWASDRARTQNVFV